MLFLNYIPILALIQVFSLAPVSILIVIAMSFINQAIENYWKQPKHHLEFFKLFAARNGFDPLVPDNWHSVSQQQIFEQKVIIHFFETIFSKIIIQNSLFYIGGRTSFGTL